MINIDDSSRKNLIRINIGLMATSFTVLLALLQVDSLDSALMITLYSCSLVFPICFCFGLMLQIYEKVPISNFLFILLKVFTSFAILSASLGLIKLIDHFSGTASVFFAFSEIVAILFYSIGVKKSKKTLEIEEKKEELRKEIIPEMDSKNIERKPRAKKAELTK